jgi:hypothetical protein
MEASIQISKESVGDQTICCKFDYLGIAPDRDSVLLNLLSMIPFFLLE